MKEFKHNIRKDGPFTVPDGYFDSLTDKVMERIGSLEAGDSPLLTEVRKRHWEFPRWVCAAAAVLLVLLMTAFLLIGGVRGIHQQKETVNPSSGSMGDIVLNLDVSDEEILNYLLLEDEIIDLYYSDLK